MNHYLIEIKYSNKTVESIKVCRTNFTVDYHVVKNGDIYNIVVEREEDIPRGIIILMGART